MIPTAFVQQWRKQAPWPQLQQVEQDLIISRALCDIFSEPALSGRLAFRGGTAINKLLFARPLRYSEDIDLVQVTAEPIGQIVDAVRAALSWMGNCRRDQAGHSMHLIFKFPAQDDSTIMLKLKVEINTREHGCCFGFVRYPFSVQNPWYSGNAQILSYVAEELFATKLRAFLQRRKNRDLFDLHHGLNQMQLDRSKVIDGFRHYMSFEPKPISKANAQERMLDKLRRSLIEDIDVLLPVDSAFTQDTAARAFEQVWNDLISRLDGDDWKLASQVIAQIRRDINPTLFSNHPIAV